MIRLISLMNKRMTAGVIVSLLLFTVFAATRTEGTDETVNETKTVATDSVANNNAAPAPIISVPYTRPFHYQARARRDPFIPLVSEGVDSDIPSIASLTLTGVIWNHYESLAILEDQRGLGYPLRVGDRIGNATLVGIKTDAAIFRVVLFGVVHMHTLKLEFKEEM